MPMIEATGETAHWLPETGVALLEGSIGDVLRRNARLWGDRPALIWPQADELSWLSYADLLVRAEHLARWLLDRIESGDRVAIWGINSVDYAVLLQACCLSGTIAAPFNPGWSDEEVAYARDLVEPKICFAGIDGRRISLADRAAVLFDCALHSLEGAMSLEGRDTGVLAAVDPAQPYLIQFTSGTTGRAKGATLSHRAALLGGWLGLGRQGYPASEEDVWMTPVPLFHVSGACSVSLGALSVGGAYVLLGRFDPDQAVKALAEAGVTRMGGVPTMIYDVLRHPDLPEKVAIEVVGMGGSNVPPSLVRAVEERTGGVVCNVFGQSECPAITAVEAEDDLETKTSTIGRPVAHAEVRIVDPETGATCACDEVGEICVRGPMIMDGYWGDPEATAATIDADGFLHTGDLGSMARDGICRIHGRHRDLIIRGGENIYPIEIENALMQHEAVDKAAIIGLPDERLGEIVGAVVMLLPGADADEAALHAHLSSRISYFKLPAKWLFVDDLPLTSTGKIRKVELPVLFARDA